jgi:hypothetical protein
MGVPPLGEAEIKQLFKNKIEKINSVIDIYNREIARGNTQRTPEFIENRSQLMKQLEMYSENMVKISTGDFPSSFKPKAEEIPKESVKQKAGVGASL